MDKIITSLIALRTDIEEQTGRDIHSIRVTVADVLDDVCRVLGLNERQTRRVIGRSYDRLETDLVALVMHHNTVLPNDRFLRQLYPGSEWEEVGAYEDVSVHPPSGWVSKVAGLGATHLIRNNDCTWIAVRPKDGANA